MILIDPPRKYYGSKRKWSHMMSTLHGVEGHEELVDMAWNIGLPPEYIQDEDKPEEHFDLYSPRIFDEAFVKGAKLVSTRRLVELREEKRCGHTRG